MWFVVTDYTKWIIFEACWSIMWGSWIVGIPYGVANGWLPLWSLGLLIIPIIAIVIAWQYEDQNKRAGGYEPW